MLIFNSVNFTNLSQAAKFVSIVIWVHKLQMGGVHFQTLCHFLESKHLDDANNSMLETWDKNIYPLEWSFTNVTHIESTTNDITDLRNIVWCLRLLASRDLRNSTSEMAHWEDVCSSAWHTTRNTLRL